MLMSTFINIVAIIQIVIYVVILMYINQLEKNYCECSKDVKRDAIKFIVLLLLVVTVILFLLSLLNINLTYIGYVRPFLSLLGIVNLVITTWYFVELQKKKNCGCSKDPKRYFLLGPIIIQVLLLIYVFMMIFRVIDIPDEFKNALKKGKKRVSIKKKN